MNILVVSLCPPAIVRATGHLLTPWVSGLGCSLLDAGAFVPVQRAVSALCDHPRRLPLPRIRLNSMGWFFMAKRAHPLYPDLLFCFDHLQLQPLVFFLLSRMYRFLQDHRADTQICHVLAVEGIVRLVVIDL